MANGNQKYVLHAQTSPPSKLALPRWTHLQPDRSLLDRRKTLIGRHRCRRGAKIDSDHMEVVINLRARICRASNTKPQQLRRFAIDRLNDRYYDELESDLQGVQAQPLSLVEKCKKLE
jgi:hypothetical protein